MTPEVDLDAYFRRIGYQGPREPTLEVLTALHALHPAAIPFEAIDLQLGRGVDISPAAVDAKLIGARRGGYCYEQNGLFKRVLTAIGFDVEGLAARVVWMAPEDAPPRPRTHMALRVTIEDDPYLADVGFGGCVLGQPLRFQLDEVQPTAHEPYRLSLIGDEVLVEIQLGEDWTPAHLLSLEPWQDVDYELPNWWTSTHPSSRFRQNLIAARTTPEARYALLNGRLTTRTVDGRTERQELDVAGLERALREVFLLPVQPDWTPMIERAVALGDGV
jgi:N-hydroxyarylamine O-acetyltransferase